MTEHPKQQPAWKTFVEYAVAAGVFAALLAGIAFGAYTCQAKAIGAAEAFFVDLREGRTQQAYESLAPERRATLSFDAFQQLVGERPYRENTEAAFGQTPQWGPVEGRMRACSHGSLRLDGDDWYVEVFMTSGDDDLWRVHSWGVQAPRVMATVMLDQCKTAWR